LAILLWSSSNLYLTSPCLGGGKRVYATHATLVGNVGESLQRKTEREQSCIPGICGAKRGLATARFRKLDESASFIDIRVEFRPQDVIIFIIGGTTYEEARTVALLNQDPTSGGTGGARLLLGGTCVHNSTRYVRSSPLIRAEKCDIDTISRSFLEMIESAASNFPAAVYEPPPESASNAPALNVNLGGVSLSLGGPAGTGVYRTSGESSGIQTDGIRDGVRSLLGKVKQGVDRIGLQ
jgi:hypothetical protein